MDRLGRYWLVPVLLGLIVLVACLWPRERTIRSSPRSTPVRTQSAPGGEEVLLEVFGPGSQGRLWRLSLATATLVAGDALDASGVHAEYTGVRQPVSLVAERMMYVAARNRLTFHGGVRLKGPGFSLVCTELTWDEGNRSFSATGGYTLTKDETVMQGASLLADADWRDIRAVGSVRLTTSAGGGDVP